MKNKKKVTFIIIPLFFFIFFGFFIFKNDYFFSGKEKLFFEENTDNHIPFLNKKEQITIASCPTFYYMLEKLEDFEEIKTIKTRSTNESLQMLKVNKVDLVISGRPLKTNEPSFLSQIIGHGYDFISQGEFLLLEKEMGKIPFFTDLSLKDIINDFEYIAENNIKEVKDINDYLSRGVVITIIEKKTDAEFIYVAKEKGSRIRLSRIPRLYYSSNIKEENIILIKEIIKEN